ncbi:MAG: hypothetical protein J7L21_06880 [Sulfurimonas sp.]|nr:hypothetical protein [Sulfurimonas sp.]
MNDYIHNKSPKDKKLCQLIRKTITINRKELGLEFDDVAFELGLSPGTLSNKLKPSMDHSDLTITEFIHFLELTGSYEALIYIATEFDLALIPKKQVEAKSSDISALVDKANIENSDVFREIKKAIEDGFIDEDEQKRILKEIDEAQTANAELKDSVSHLTIKEE